MFYKIKQTTLFLITGMLAINAVSAQTVRKVGENPGIINDRSAVLEIESTDKGILPPRMTKVQRNAIVSPADGLQVWCTDCNSAGAVSSTGEFCVYLNAGWTSFKMFTTPVLTTDSVTKTSDGSVSVNGTLVDFFGDKPSENGIVYKQITDNDFQTPPVLDASGNAGAGVYKLQSITVTAPDKPIAVNIPVQNATIGGRGPYSFRTYAKNSFGIGYGKPVILDREPPFISTPIVNAVSPPIVTAATYGNSPSSLIFSGTLTVNAGTPKGTITEYGYCSGTNSNPTTANNKVVLSTGTSIANLDAVLSSAVFVKDFTVDLTVNNYIIKDTGKTYFRYYVIANGVTIYSDEVNFFPVDSVTGGTAVATVTRVDPISQAFDMGENAARTIAVHFNVKKAGDYKAFVNESLSGATRGLTMVPVLAGNFAPGEQILTFVISGLPTYSFEGNSFVISRTGTRLNTGAIGMYLTIPGNVYGNSAFCDNSHTTTIKPFLSRTGKVWMDRNLGASSPGTGAEFDYTAYGCLYQWGRSNDGHASINWDRGGDPVNGTIIGTSSSDNPGTSLFFGTGNRGYWRDWRDPPNDNLWQGVNGINNPCPKGYRIPTNQELTNEINMYEIHNISDAVASPFKFAAAGSRLYDQGGVTLYDKGTYIYLWTSSIVNDSGKSGSYYRLIELNGTRVVATIRSFGLNVRCIKDKI